MHELARFIGFVEENNGKKLFRSQGKALELIGATQITPGSVYRIVGVLSDNALRVEHARKLDGFDIGLYEKALASQAVKP